MVKSKSIRSESSASSNQTASSLLPASLDAKAESFSSSSSSRMQKSEYNGHAKHERPGPGTFGARARSASLQKGVAVLKALARAPQDLEEEVDSGYEGEGGVDVGLTPGKIDEGIAEEDDSIENLSEEAKESGRQNRESLRKRKDDKKVERIVGVRSNSSSSDTELRKDKKRAKSWEIPRKIFHSSIGFLVLYLYISDTNLSLIVRNLSIFLGIVVTADVLRLNIAIFETIYELVLGFLMRESEKEKVNGVVWYLIGVITCLQFFPADIACVSIMILSWADTAASVFGRLYGAHTPALPSPPFAGRKSSAGFFAAFVAASLTAAVFWATPIAQIGKRPEGLSIYDDFGRAVLGTRLAPGPLNSGWTGLNWGFRPSHPNTFTTSSTQNILNSVTDTIKMATDAAFNSSNQGKPIPFPLLCLASGIVAAVAEGLELGGVDDNLSLPILTAIGIHSTLVSWGWLASKFT